MAGFDVKSAAEELMLEPEDLQDIFEFFFSEADEIVPRCEEALEAQDAGALKSHLHAIKGSAANLRITGVSELALKLEGEAAQSNFAAIAVAMQTLRHEINLARAVVNSFYGN